MTIVEVVDAVSDVMLGCLTVFDHGSLHLHCHSLASGLIWG